MLMNRATARRPISSPDQGGFPGQFPPSSGSQPEATATQATPLPTPSAAISGAGELGTTSFDPGTLPMPPLPPPPPGSNLPIALPGFQGGREGGAVGGRSMMGPPPSGMNLFGGGEEGGEAPDEDLMRRILAGLPQGR